MKILTPATSANLGPGFDTLGLAIKLYNEVVITKQNFRSVCINGEGSDKIGLKKNNTFILIFNEILSQLTGEQMEFRFNFTNNIPFSRGLGSSSSVIVAAIASAYHMAGFKVDKSVVLNKALKYESHIDNISPAVWGGFTTNLVHNGAVYTQRAQLGDELRAVVVIPDKPMSTKQSRNKLPKSYNMIDTVNNVSHASYLTACFLKKDYSSLKIACIDKMHEDYRMPLLPELYDVRKIAYENGSLMSTLSGSGSTFFNLVYRDDAKKIADVLKQSFPNFRVEIYEFDNNGFEIVQS
ncbi:homoserine kinase [Campylobacter iguaniorum]|uniref:homoserine kinase n=1 Tax=Campylobacter iguaniorum TaxID=1244531 RepID=UPI0007C95200|nr:homoserine kinase [Campylobacter iguaniorum]ANE35410.1 homoserine kinase [Campylobacter iguaniorum]